MAIEIILPAWEAGRWIAGFLAIFMILFLGTITAYATKNRSWEAIPVGVLTMFFLIALLTIWKFLVWTFV